MQPDRVLLALMDDRVVAKGLVLHWVTAFFQVLAPIFKPLQCRTGTRLGQSISESVLQGLGIILFLHSCHSSGNVLI